MSVYGEKGKTGSGGKRRSGMNSDKRLTFADDGEQGRNLTGDRAGNKCDVAPNSSSSTCHLGSLYRFF